MEVLQGLCHFTMAACLIRTEPGPGTQPGLVCPTSKPVLCVWDRGPRDTDTDTADEKRKQGESTQRTDVPTRVRGKPNLFARAPASVKVLEEFISFKLPGICASGYPRLVGHFVDSQVRLSHRFKLPRFHLSEFRFRFD
jgi:hypothetical protein